MSATLNKHSLGLKDVESDNNLWGTLNKPSFLTKSGSMEKFDILVTNPMRNQDFPQNRYENDAYNRFGYGYPQKKRHHSRQGQLWTWPIPTEGQEVLKKITCPERSMEVRNKSVISALVFFHRLPELIKLINLLTNIHKQVAGSSGLSVSCRIALHNPMGWPLYNL